jgi:hypothetical protein
LDVPKAVQFVVGSVRKAIDYYLHIVATAITVIRRVQRLAEVANKMQYEFESKQSFLGVGISSASSAFVSLMIGFRDRFLVSSSSRRWSFLFSR